MGDPFDHDLIHNFVAELRPVLDTVDRGVHEALAPESDTIVIGEAIQALSVIRRASQMLFLADLVTMTECLSEMLEHTQHLDAIDPAAVGEPVTEMARCLRSYVNSLENDQPDSSCVARAHDARDRVMNEIAHRDRILLGATIPLEAGPSVNLADLPDLDLVFDDDPPISNPPSGDLAPLEGSSATHPEVTEDDQAEPGDEPLETLLAILDEDLEPDDVAVSNGLQPISNVQPDASSTDDSLPIEWVSTDEVDPEVREIFLEEARELVGSFTEHALKLVGHAERQSSLLDLRRDAHTLKGAANMTGFPIIGHLGAALENLLDAHVDGNIAVNQETLKIVLSARRILVGMLPQLDDLSSFAGTVHDLTLKAEALTTSLRQTVAPSEHEAQEEVAVDVQISLAAKLEEGPRDTSDTIAEPDDSCSPSTIIDRSEVASNSYDLVLSSLSSEQDDDASDRELEERDTVLSIAETSELIPPEAGQSLTAVPMTDGDRFSGEAGTVTEASEPIAAAAPPPTGADSLLEPPAPLTEMLDSNVDQDNQPAPDFAALFADLDIALPDVFSWDDDLSGDAIGVEAAETIEWAIEDEADGKLTSGEDEEPDLFELVEEIASLTRTRNLLRPDNATLIPDDLLMHSLRIDALSSDLVSPAAPAPVTTDATGAGHRDSVERGSISDVVVPAGDERSLETNDTIPEDVSESPAGGGIPENQPSGDLLGSALLDLAFDINNGSRADRSTANADGAEGSHSSDDLNEAFQREMLETFAQEVADHINLLSRAAIALERNPADSEAVREIHRSLHTLKGAAGAVGFVEISEQCHELEDILANLDHHGQRPDQQFIKRLLGSIDEIERLLLAEHETLHGSSEAVPVDEVEPAAVVRVGINRLDVLLDLVGEMVVNRSAFEQRLQRLGSALDELGLMADRLRRSSVVLDRRALESGLFGLHAQSASSIQPHVEANGHAQDFDPLEMDRYTELDRLVRELAEVAADITAATSELGQLRGDLDTVSTRQRRLTTALQDELMDVRMVPVGVLAPRLYRTTRSVASERGKDVDLVFEGGDTRVDKPLLDALSDALLHLIRNAVDHGVESPTERRNLHKPERGKILIRAYRDGNQAVIEVVDDGRGIDHGTIRDRARELNYPVHDDMPPDEVLQFIFLPGFSTREGVDEVSGRGVGLDVVKSTVNRFKGQVTVESRPGSGTVFCLRLPVMLAVVQAFMVIADGKRYALPAAGVEFVADRRGAQIDRVGEAIVLAIGDSTVPAFDLGARLGSGRPGVILEPEGHLLVLRTGNERWAVRVDALEGQQEIVVKPLGRFLKTTPGIIGATILGDGQIAPILDVAQLAAIPYARSERSDRTPLPVRAIVEASTPRVALIVDDSLSVRRVLSRTLERHGWTTVLARDGVEAMEMIERHDIDIVVTDIEMPRMDGFELISSVRRQSLTSTLPVVVLTSRSGNKHRTKAFDLGASAYLVKPFHERELVETLELAAGARVTAGM